MYQPIRGPMTRGEGGSTSATITVCTCDVGLLQEDFAKQTYTCLQRSKGFMADCARKMNALITKFVEREKEVCQVSAGACRCDVPL